VLQRAADRVVVGERAVVDEALILAGRERMSAVGGHGGLGRHPGVTDAVRPAHAGQSEFSNNLFRQADLLVDLHGLADADELQTAFLGTQPSHERRSTRTCYGQHDVS